MGRPRGWRAVKVNRSYTVDEAARNQNVSKGTIRRWDSAGLPIIKDRKPWLILGGDLVDFLKGRKPPKQKCKLDECFCFKCRAPRKAAFGEAYFKPVTPTNGQLIALCEDCTTLMQKRVSMAALKALEGILKVKFKQPAKALAEIASPCLNDD